MSTDIHSFTNIRSICMSLLFVDPFFPCSLHEEPMFYCDEFPRPLGFICADPYSGEGYLMQF